MTKLFSSKLSHKGFTLIELLVVIAIIGMLSSIVFASLNNARVKGRKAAAQGTMRSAFTAAQLCMDDGKDLNTPAAGTQVCVAGTYGTYGAPPSAAWTYSPTGSPTLDKTSSDGTFSFSMGGAEGTITCTETGCI